MALAGAGFRVEIVAFVESPVGGELATNPAVLVSAIAGASPPGESRRAVGRVIGRAIRQVARVAVALVRSEPAALVIVQNPPALHVLPLLLLLCWWRRSLLIVDWHNFGWTILGLSWGPTSRLVSGAGWLERNLGRRARRHLCVTEAMRRELDARLAVDAIVLRDRPAARFVAAAAVDRAAHRRSVLPRLELTKAECRALCDGRSRLLVSSTSWSSDEDFAVLLEALGLWANRSDAVAWPHLIVAVSGNGPLRAAFEARARAVRLAGITLRTVWLCESEYPALLAAADLGISLHRSSSGVDFPMKVADMLGVGLPTCVLDYGPCLHEVLRDGDNCFLFEDAAGLTRIWESVFVDSPERLTAMRARLAAEPRQTWQEHWCESMAPLLSELSEAESDGRFH